MQQKKGHSEESVKQEAKQQLGKTPLTAQNVIPEPSKDQSLEKNKSPNHSSHYSLSTAQSAIRSTASIQNVSQSGRVARLYNSNYSSNLNPHKIINSQSKKCDKREIINSISNIFHQKEKVEEECKNLKDAKEKLQQQNKVLAIQIIDYKNKAEGRYENMVNSYAHLAEKMKEKGQQNDALKEKIDKSNRQKGNLEEKIIENNQQICTLKNKSKQQSNQNAELTKTFKQSEDKHKRDIEELQRKLQEELLRYQREMKSKDEDISGLKARLKEVQVEKALAEQRNEDLERFNMIQPVVRIELSDFDSEEIPSMIHQKINEKQEALEDKINTLNNLYLQETKEKKQLAKEKKQLAKAKQKLLGRYQKAEIKIKELQRKLKDHESSCSLMGRIFLEGMSESGEPPIKSFLKSFDNSEE